MRESTLKQLKKYITDCAKAKKASAVELDESLAESSEFIVVDWREDDHEVIRLVEKKTKTKFKSDLESELASVQTKDRRVTFQMDGSEEDRIGVLGACREALAGQFDFRILRETLDDDTRLVLIETTPWWDKLEAEMGKKAVAKAFATLKDAGADAFKYKVGPPAKPTRVIKSNSEAVEYWGPEKPKSRRDKIEAEVFEHIKERLPKPFEVEGTKIIRRMPYGFDRLRFQFQQFYTEAYHGIEFDAMNDVYERTYLRHTFGSWHIERDHCLVRMLEFKSEHPKKIADQMIAHAIPLIEEFSKLYGDTSKIWERMNGRSTVQEKRGWTCLGYDSKYLALAIPRGDVDAVRASFRANAESKHQYADITYSEFVRAYWRILKAYPEFRFPELMDKRFYSAIKVLLDIRAERAKGESETRFTRNSKSIFFDKERIRGADPKSWRALSERYSCDDHHVFYMEKAIEGADPISFEVIPAEDNDCFAKDKNHYYDGWHAITEREFNMAYAPPMKEAMKASGLKV